MSGEDTIQRAKQMKIAWDFGRSILQVLGIVIAGAWAVKSQLADLSGDLSDIKITVERIQQKNTKMWDEHWGNNLRLHSIEKKMDKYHE